MSRIIKCSNGHFFDQDKFPDCPYCAKAMGSFRPQQSSRYAPNRQEIKSDDDVTVAIMPGVQNIELSPPAHKDPVIHIPVINRVEKKVQKVFPDQVNRGNPLAGWLVCIEGACIGRDFRIRHGRNMIGAWEQNDICIPDDPDIAGDSHCTVIYDLKGNCFYLSQGTGTLTYHNGQLVRQPCELRQGDTITVGNHTFEFIPFCREGHTWADIGHRKTAREEQAAVKKKIPTQGAEENRKAEDKEKGKNDVS